MIQFEYDKNFNRTPFKVRLPRGYKKLVVDNMMIPLIYDKSTKNACCPICGEIYHYTNRLKAYKRIVCSACGRSMYALPMHYYGDAEYYYMHMWRASTDKIRFAVIKSFWHNLLPKSIVNVSRWISVKAIEVGEISRAKQQAYVKSVLHDNWYKHADCSISNINTLIIDYCNKDITKTLTNSFLKYSGLAPAEQNWPAKDIIKRIALYAKYPQAEYIAKSGLGEYIEDKIKGYVNYVYPNWHAKSVTGFLRLTPQEWDKLKQWGAISPRYVAMYHAICKARSKPTKKQLVQCVKWFTPKTYADSYKKYEPAIDIVSLATYLEKSYKAKATQDWAVSPYMIRNLYSDYINQAHKLGYPLNQSYYAYPPELQQAHDRASEEYQQKQETERRLLHEQQEKKWKEEILPELEATEYQDDKYLIRPLKSYDDFRNEGINNHNCVASYYDRAMAGKVRIYMMRQVDAPEESFVTIEITVNSPHRIRQCLGKGNRLPEQEVVNWVKNWLKTIVNKKEI